MKRILIADDKQSMREMLTQTMQDKGYEVVAVADGDAAVAQATSGLDLVITDMRMPGRDGLDVLRAMKSASPETEVIVMTAFGTIPQAVEAVRLGAADYITKPLESPAALRRLVRMVLGADYPLERMGVLSLGCPGKG